MSEVPVAMDTTPTVVPPAECLCACACICYPPCRPSSSVLESAHARVHWHHIGARTGGGRYATDVAQCFGANPVKIIQPRRRPVDGTARMDEDESELPPSERCAKFMLDASALATVRAIEPFPAASVRRAFLDASPQNDSIASVVYLSSYGGGICAPDHITIDLALGQDATAALTTQGYSKIYAPQRRGLTIAQHKEAIAAAASQRLSLRIGTGALFLWLPEPTLLHAGAYFRAPTTIELGDTSASVLWMDWLYAGRVARGEVYDFAHFQTQLHVHVVGADAPTPILMETMTLEQEDLGSILPPAPPPVSGKLPDLSARTPSNLAQRLLPYKTYATVVLLGTRLEPLAAGIHAHVSSMHLGSKSLAPPSVLLSTQWIEVPVNSASGESLRGVVFRMSAVEIEQLHAVMKIYFSCLDDLIQVEPPWHKA